MMKEYAHYVFGEFLLFCPFFINLFQLKSRHPRSRKLTMKKNNHQSCSCVYRKLNAIKADIYKSDECVSGVIYYEENKKIFILVFK